MLSKTSDMWKRTKTVTASIPASNFECPLSLSHVTSTRIHIICFTDIFVASRIDHRCNNQHYIGCLSGNMYLSPSPLVSLFLGYL
ncbi:hypothetical protein A0H81_06006 [Grifola frondosa]|uniref:Uncharacterized protein n=1 Tax=Grifola frondosa TaxID=5627 RepID=A0A1C7MBA1_GRIFR|nr:hypothetical protein A0H81_06006 [Grifola frondosa]